MSQPQEIRKATTVSLKFVLIAALLALPAFVLAAPAAAASHPEISLSPPSAPAEAGDVTVTISGTNFSGNLNPFFVTTCPGAEGDPSALASIAEGGGDVTSLLAAATAVCPNILTDSASPEWSEGGFSLEKTITLTDEDISNGGIIVLAAGLAGTSPEFAFALLAADDSMMSETEGEMTELAETGVNSALLFTVGVLVLGAGLIVLTQARRLRAAVSAN